VGIVARREETGMADQTNAKRRRRGIVATALAVLVGSLGVAAGAAVPAAADPPTTSAGNVLHGFRLDDDGNFHVIDHPDAATTIGPNLPVTGTNLSGINNRLEIVGVYEDESRVLRNFLRTRTGRYQIIDPPGSFANEEPVDINNRGHIVGFVDEDGDNGAGTRSFLRTRRGHYLTIEVPGAGSTLALKVNDRRQVAGFYYDEEPPGATPPPVHGFVWDNGEVTTIDHPDAVNGTYVYGINNRGDTVGSYYDADDRAHGFLRDRRGRYTAIDVPGAERGTLVLSVNDRGETVGSVVNADYSSDGFYRSRRGRTTIIEAPGEATYTRALDINDHGDIVGDYDTEPPSTNDNAISPQPSPPSPPKPPVQRSTTISASSTPTTDMRRLALVE
jgi:hypothetical protein